MHSLQTRPMRPGLPGHWSGKPKRRGIHELHRKTKHKKMRMRPNTRRTLSDTHQRSRNGRRTQNPRLRILWRTNNTMLTKAMLEAMPPGTIFAIGTAINSPSDIYMTQINLGGELIRVAKRWDIHDWAIYVKRKYRLNIMEQRTLWAEILYSEVVTTGDKIITEEFIRKLVPCDDEAFKLYRY